MKRMNLNVTHVKIALVHDYLMQDGGAEKVLEILQEMWPDAPTYVLLFDPEKMSHFAKKDIRVSFLQKMPFAKHKYQWLIGLMPSATESYDLREFDVVISSTSAFAKGILTRPDATHICYCHTPTRYLWSDTNSYIQELRVPRVIKLLLPPLLSRLRLWDRVAADRVDIFLANSQTVADRIKKYYRKEAQIIYPPVDTHRFAPSATPKTYFLAGGRLVAYKRFDLIIEAAIRADVPLKIFGTGPMETALKERAAGARIEFLGRVSEVDQKHLYENALAFIHPQEEDFGITAVEAMAAGTPVIAYKKGGATETIIEGKTGLFFDEQTPEALSAILKRFSRDAFDSNVINAHAQTFNKEVFIQRLSEVVAKYSSSSPS